MPVENLARPGLFRSGSASLSSTIADSPSSAFEFFQVFLLAAEHVHRGLGGVVCPGLAPGDARFEECLPVLAGKESRRAHVEFPGQFEKTLPVVMF